MSRSPSRTAALALAIAAIAAPAAQAQDLVTPDARDAGRPAAKVDLVSPDARDNGRREPAPIVVSEPVTTGDAFDWFDAGVGAAGLALLAVGCGAAISLRTRRHTVGA